MEKLNLTEREVAPQYGVSVHWLRRKRWEGGGPVFIKLGAKVLYPVAQLDEYFAARLRKSTSDPGQAA